MGYSVWGHLDWGCLSPQVSPVGLLLPFCHFCGELKPPGGGWPDLLTDFLANSPPPSLISCVVSSSVVFSFHSPHPFQCIAVLQDCMVYDGLTLMAGYCLAFRFSFSSGFQTVEREILGEMLQSFMSYQKHFIWELRSLWGPGGGSHCPHSRALFSSRLTAGRTWSFESKCFSCRIRAIHGEANPSLTVGKGCVVCGSLNTCLMVNSMPRGAYRDVFWIAIYTLEWLSDVLFP